MFHNFLQMSQTTKLSDYVYKTACYAIPVILNVDYLLLFRCPFVGPHISELTYYMTYIIVSLSLRPSLYFCFLVVCVYASVFMHSI